MSSEDKLIEKMILADRVPFDEANEHKLNGTEVGGNIAIRLWCDKNMVNYATHLPIFEEEEHFLEYLDDTMQHSKVEIPVLPNKLIINEVEFSIKEIRKIFWLSSLQLIRD